MYFNACYKNNESVENVGPQIRLRLFTFRPIASKQLKSLTLSDTLSWLSDKGVAQLLCLRMVSGSIAGYGKVFY